MFKAKYIIGGRLQSPIVFPETINHAEMARNCGWSKEDIIGAGFVYIRDYQYFTYGESVSLRVKSRGNEDSEILNRYLGGLVDEN
jgi:hypothetical protein